MDIGQQQHQHPITYAPSGDPAVDFRYSIEQYDADLTAYLPAEKAAPILDVGCGWGQCLWWLKERGYTNAVGIDIGADQIRHNASLGLSSVQVPDAGEYLLQHGDRFDLILMNHVIEHVPADEGIKLLRAILAALKPGGRAVIQTPNMNALGANAGRYIEVSHVTGYGENSLSQLMELAGFADVKAYGGSTPIRYTPKRLAWLALQKASRLAWRLMLLGDLGSDAPRILDKNLYATGVKK
jgi:SAM-dependent methyltransferase